MSESDTKRCISAIREGIQHLLADTESRLYLPDAEVLFAPNTVTSALLLSAWDHSLQRGLTSEQFLELAERLTGELRRLLIPVSGSTDEGTASQSD